MTHWTLYYWLLAAEMILSIVAVAIFLGILAWNIKQEGVDKVDD